VPAAKPKVHYIVRDMRAGEGEPKLVRAAHSSLEEAVTQFELDLELGLPVVRIEDEKGAIVREA
jgi:hypothetical protein